MSFRNDYAVHIVHSVSYYNRIGIEECFQVRMLFVNNYEYEYESNQFFHRYLLNDWYTMEYFSIVYQVPIHIISKYDQIALLR